MQCGPVRHRVDPKSQALRRGFHHKVREARNSVIFDDVVTALEARRWPLILTERRDHLEALRARFERFTRNLVVLHGGLSAGELRTAQAGLQAGGSGERLVLATGRYLGEGFDDSLLDTLFLVMPISSTGTLAQYVGRLHRDHDGKREVIVYEYVDQGCPYSHEWPRSVRRATKLWDPKNLFGFSTIRMAFNSSNSLHATISNKINVLDSRLHPPKTTPDTRTKSPHV